MEHGLILMRVAKHQHILMLQKTVVGYFGVPDTQHLVLFFLVSWSRPKVENFQTTVRTIAHAKVS